MTHPTNQVKTDTATNNKKMKPKVTPETEQWLVANRESFELVGSSCIESLTPNDEDRVAQIKSLPLKMRADVWDNAVQGRSDYETVVVKVEHEGQKYDFLICMEEEEYNSILTARDTLNLYLYNKDSEVRAMRQLKVSEKAFRAGWYEAHRYNT